jgi:hypothetical protein
MVTKLGLKTEKHPSPYKIGWIRQGAEAKVTEICRIQFSIGKNYLLKSVVECRLPVLRF